MNNRMLEIRQQTAQGLKKILTHLASQRLSFKQAVAAHCYDSVGFYADRKTDCGMKHCPLHPFIAFNPGRKNRLPRTISKAHMEKMREARHAND